VSVCGMPQRIPDECVFRYVDFDSYYPTDHSYTLLFHCNILIVDNARPFGINRQKLLEYIGLAARSLREKLAIQALSKSMTGVKLDALRLAFAYEYSVDFDHRRAATVIGTDPDQGAKLINEPEIREAVQRIYNDRMYPGQITSEVVKEEMYNLYQIALNTGNLSQAGRQLDQLAKHSHIDAYAAQKVTVAADAEVARALRAGRERVAAMNREGDAPGSFL